MTARSPWRCAHPSCGRGYRPGAAGAFSLVEIMVVVAIILVVLGMTLPAITRLWDDRKMAEALNVVQGLLVTTRARAMQPGAGESGLFFFVDEQGAQRIVSIEQADATDPTWANVFRITDVRDFVLPSPIRVVPRYAVTEEGQDNQPYAFSAEELANNDFTIPISDNVAQRHRNFFTMVYSNRGELVVSRDVLIQDVDEDTSGPGQGKGDVTGLFVGENATNGDVLQYWPIDGDPENLDPSPPHRPVPWLIAQRGGSDNGTAINFPSVDGLLVYDDSLFKEAGTNDEKRAFLLRSAQPFYVNRLTGIVIQGPVGESE